MLAAAFVDAFYREGPFAERKIRVLSVSPSSAQQQLLQGYLNKLDIAVDRAGSIEEAVSALSAEKYQAVIASNVLPDGDAPLLSKRMRGVLKQDVPRLVVWTSNPENIFGLRDPEHKIDDVVLKPSADAGVESLLLSIIIGVYQTKV
jgi:DNA-binding response OmpR family regulator